MALDHVNCYALEDDEGWTLVDTGMANRHTKALWQALMAGPLRGKPVTRLIVTHHHPDHIGLAGWFQAQGVRTAHNPHRLALCPDADAGRPAPALARIPAVLCSAPGWTRPGATPGPHSARSTFPTSYRPLPLGFTRIGEGDVITAGGRRWQVAHRPGPRPRTCHAVEPG